MRRGAVIAALAGELGPLTRGWRREQAAGAALWSRDADGDLWLAVCAGAGAKAAGRAFTLAERNGPLDWVASAGWAGALDPALLPGRAYAVSEVVDAETGERFPSALAAPGPRLVSNPGVAGAEEKRGLRARHGADLVDMEAAAVARLARARSIPFHCVKGVSDGAGERLPDFNRFLGPDGGLRLAPFMAHALPRPGLWPGLMRLGRDSRAAAEAIAAELERRLGRPD